MSAIAAVSGTSLGGFHRRTLGGPIGALIFQAAGFLSGLLGFIVARRLSRSSHRAMFADVSLYTATFPITCLAGVGLPTCQLPTGNSPCTSLSVNSSIMLRSYSSIVSILSPWMPAMRPRRRARVSGAGMSMA
jgi:hypothetical protein